jgi:hypothetical protein
VVGFTIGSRGKVPGKTCEKIIIIIIINIATSNIQNSQEDKLD